MGKEGIIYVLSNPTMPGILKIGLTTHDDVKVRMDELYKTGVPLPFDCEYAAKVRNLDQVERALHTAFSDKRINPKREFFNIEIEQVKVIIKLLEIENVTPRIIAEEESDQADIVDKKASKEFQQKRPRFNFMDMNIPVGSLIYSNVINENAEVLTERTVKFRDETMSLNQATRICLNLPEGEHNRQGTPYWTFEGKKLIDIYNETYI